MQAGDFSGALVAETLQELARKKQQMQLAQAREREQLLGGLSAGRAGGGGRNSTSNNGYATPSANQIREMKAKHRKVRCPARSSSDQPNLRRQYQLSHGSQPGNRTRRRYICPLRKPNFLSSPSTVPPPRRRRRASGYHRLRINARKIEPAGTPRTRGWPSIRAMEGLVWACWAQSVAMLGPVQTPAVVYR